MNPIASEAVNGTPETMLTSQEFINETPLETPLQKERKPRPQLAAMKGSFNGHLSMPRYQTGDYTIPSTLSSRLQRALDLQVNVF